MVGALFVLFLQSVAGVPAAPPAADSGPAAADSAQAAGAENATAQQQAGTAADERRRMRCRTETVLGSRLSRRVCLTQAEEDAWRQDSRDYLNRAQSQMPLSSQ